MTRRNMPPRPKLVEVIWDDAHADLTEASQAELDEFHQSAIMETVGWLLRDDHAGVTIANERCAHDQTFRGRTFIPRPLVRTVRWLAGPRKRKASPEDHQPSRSADGRTARNSDVLAGRESRQPLA